MVLKSTVQRTRKVNRASVHELQCKPSQARSSDANEWLEVDGVITMRYLHGYTFNL